MLRKHPKYRTEAELNTLFSAIGGLKCFRQWPDYVKFKLVSCTYFVYYPAGRTIVKQNREAEALYFVIAGSVNVEKEVKMSSKYVLNYKASGLKKISIKILFCLY